ncbi:MAG TPA: GntR family transcriptional regulator [Longimicrobiales bacterium]|nr:GntR family transcriptional regulator [Longimicrobiales bacterium]
MAMHPIAKRIAARLASRGAEPVPHLIVQDIWSSVVDGTLEVGERLPTARELAVALGVSPRAVDGAYDQLERLGVTTTRRGEGTFVGLSQPSEAERRRHQELHAIGRDAVERAEAIGFDVVDLLETIDEYRDGDRAAPDRAPRRRT